MRKIGFIRNKQKKYFFLSHEKRIFWATKYFFLTDSFVQSIQGNEIIDFIYIPQAKKCFVVSVRLVTPSSLSRFFVSVCEANLKKQISFFPPDIKNIENYIDLAEKYQKKLKTKQADMTQGLMLGEKINIKDLIYKQPGLIARKVVAYPSRKKNFINKKYGKLEILENGGIPKDIDLATDGEFIYISVNKKSKQYFTWQVKYDIAKKRIFKNVRIIDDDKPELKKQLINKKIAEIKEWKQKKSKELAILNDSLLGLKPTPEELDKGFANLAETEGNLQSDLALVLLGCLYSDLHEKKINFKEFSERYNACVSKLRKELPLKPVSRNTISRWRKIKLNEIRNRIYDVCRADKILIPYMRSIAIGDFWEMATFLQKDKEKPELVGKIRNFVGKESQKAVDELSAALPLSIVLSALNSPKDDHNTKNTLSMLCEPPLSGVFKRPERKVKKVNGVPFDILNRNPSHQIDKFRGYIETLKKIDNVAKVVL